MENVSVLLYKYFFNPWLISRLILQVLAILPLTVFSQIENDESPNDYHHQIEIFPIMAVFEVYSLQYSYRITPHLSFITGLAYVNVDVDDPQGNKIGKMHSPTLSLGLRAYFWSNAHVEYQLWPAYNFYYDRVGDRYYNGFDLYNELRAGYRVDFTLAGMPFFTNLQYVFGFGLYPGNKPENFIEATEDAPIFHVPSISVGMRF